MTTHKLSRTPEYRTWINMKTRCTNEASPDYPKYGGRGITIDERWSKFDNFLTDMGPRPSKQHSLERIKNDLGYGPDNCRWATRLEQNNNRRANHIVDYHGYRMTLAEAVRAAGSVVLHATANSRIRCGWSVRDAVETPNKFRRKVKSVSVSEEMSCVITNSPSSLQSSEALSSEF